MLSARDLELLTAFVDGELTRRQRKAVLRLLHQSSEARSVLQDLQENAHRLRELPHLKIGQHFADQVVETIANRGLRPALEPQPACRRRLPRWVLYAAAACVLLALGLGIYLSTLQPSNNGASGTMAKFDVIPPRVPSNPLHVAFKDLAQKPEQELLSKRLRQEPAVHLDVTVRDGAKAIENLQTALQGQGIQLIVDPTIQADLKKPGAKVQYVIFAENVGADELEKILRQVATLPKGQQAPAANFRSMVVSSFSPDDRRNLAGLLGLSELDDAKGADDGNLFENKIMPKGNDSQSAPVPARHSNRYAVVLAANLGHLGVNSPEVKRFLDSRQRHRPGTLQVVLVIHTA